MFHRWPCSRLPIDQEVALQKQVKDQENRVKAATPDGNQLKELEKKVGALKKTYDQAQEVSTKVEDIVQK